jgi:hypothetical protein
MRVELNVLESATEPRVSVQRQPALMMALRTGYVEVGSRCSEMKRQTGSSNSPVTRCVRLRQALEMVAGVRFELTTFGL